MWQLIIFCKTVRERQGYMVIPFSFFLLHAWTYNNLRPATLLKKRLWNRCFPMNFVKFLRTFFLQNSSGRLLPTNLDNYKNEHLSNTWLNYESCTLNLFLTKTTTSRFDILPLHNPIVVTTSTVVTCAFNTKERWHAALMPKC